MISLSLPDATEIHYFNYQGRLIGPLSTTKYMPGLTTYVQTDVDELGESRGIYGENNVVHTKAEGSLNYWAAYSDISPAYTSTYPQRIDFRHWSRYSPGVETSTYFIYGYNTQTAYEISGGRYENNAFDGNPYDFTRYTVVQSYYNGEAAAITRYNAKYRQSDGITIEFDYEVESFSIPPGTSDAHWNSERSYADILALWASISASENGYTTRSTLSGPLYQAVTRPVFSPTQARGMLNSIVHGMTQIKDPLVGVHFGDLAAEATSKVNTLDINMIAFLADLRNIRDLVPKLRNLRKLKTLADNYLTVEYGILPTIDDLQAIWGALQKHKSAIDRNGFKVFHAVSTDSKIEDVVSFRLEQRVKVAISHYGVGLGRIASYLDNVGVLPKLESIWDLIPYSFVIDWFIGIGDFLGRLDSIERAMRLGVRYATMSEKRTMSFYVNATSELPISGTIELVRYRRWVSDQCPVPPLSATNPGDFDHWIEGTALVIQRKK